MYRTNVDNHYRSYDIPKIPSVKRVQTKWFAPFQFMLKMFYFTSS